MEMARGTTEHGSGTLLGDLLRPEAYPALLPTRVDLATTHISRVFLTDRDVWKVKRPVAYGFVDYSTMKSRRHFCEEEEVRLNRRLAPDVDHAVHLRRLPDAASAEALVCSGGLTHEHLWLLAGMLARFYPTCPAMPAYGAVEAILANASQNFDQVRPFIGQRLSAAAFEAVRAWQLGFLARHAHRFEDRAKGISSATATATSAWSTSTSRAARHS
jgi:aminoglycoside phosphotransferase family enzyme